MADETNTEIPLEKTILNSSSNEGTPSSSFHHIEETNPQRRFSNEDNNNNSHIQSIENGDDQNHNHNSSNIQSTQSEDDHSTDTHFIQDSTSSSNTHSEDDHSTKINFIEETIPTNHDDSTSSSHHIVPVTISYDDAFNQIIASQSEQDSSQTHETSLEQSTVSNNEEELNTSNNEDQSNSSHMEHQLNSFNHEELNAFNTEDQSNTEDRLNNSNNQDQSNSFNHGEEFNTEDQSNTFNNLDQINNQDDSKLLFVDNENSNIETDFHIQSNIHEKPDELKAQRELDEDEIPPVEVPIDNTPITINSSTELETNLIDDRLLTELETPYEHHYHENETNNLSLSSLPDLVTETLEQNHDDYIPQTIELEKPLFEEIPVKIENNTEEILPPLPPASIALEQTLEQDINDLIKEDEKLLLSNTESVPSEPEDVLKNKTLFKQTIDKGIPNTRPTRSTMATVSYTLSLIDNLTSNIRVIETISNETFFISECDIIPAIDICVQLMDRGERALIDSDIRHCYGEIGCEEKQIPPISSNNSYRMKIDLELHDWKPSSDVQTLAIDERLSFGDKKRQMGNFYYRRQDYLISLQCYRGALRFLDIDNNPIRIPFEGNQRSIFNDRYIQVENNVAQVNLHLNKYQDCLNAVENVLKHDSKNIKALFRKGKALFELGKHDLAIQPLKLIKQIQRGDSNINSDKEKINEMIQICESKMANDQKNEKEIYRRMFQPTTTTTTTTTTVNQQQQNKNANQTDNNSWWPYLALGSGILAAIGLATFIKYRKVS